MRAHHQIIMINVTMLTIHVSLSLQDGAGSCNQ
jgi:hypothetical protein